jgi:hypothetical protein
MSFLRRRSVWTGILCAAAVASSFAAPLQRDKDNKNVKEDDRRPKLSLKAQPAVSISPARVVLTAELSGGSNDFEEYYCATVAWDWGDGTESESTLDCEPYTPGKSEIKRRFTVQHTFRAGAHKVGFRLKRNDKTLAVANVTIQVQPGSQENQ